MPQNETAVDVLTIPSKSSEHLEDVPTSMQQITASDPIIITSNTAPIPMDISENNTNETNELSENVSTVVMNASSTELTATPISSHSTVDKIMGLTSPTTPSVPKERKKRIIIDDDDESPTFNPLRSNKKIRGKNRRSRNNLLLKKRKCQLLSSSDKLNENAVFTSPEGIVSITLNLETGISFDLLMNHEYQCL